jgi:hypothetical protein
MATTFHCGSFQELLQLMHRHDHDRERGIERAVKRAARVGRRVVQQNIPVAFGELRESVHVDGTRIVVDAPHAAPVETGSRPHMPPLEPLLNWVKLRAAQGLLTERQRGRLPGATTRARAEGLAAQIHAMEKDGAVDADAPMRIARAIQQAISRRGTKPHWYARMSLPEIREALDAFIREELKVT